MPEFVNPFVGMVPGRKLSDRELIRALRLSLSAEEEATHLYDALADATDNPLARKVLRDIADEERVHKGEFNHLIKLLAPDEAKLLADGAEEVEEMRAEVEGRDEEEETEESGKAKKDIPTIGNLKGDILGD